MKIILKDKKLLRIMEIYGNIYHIKFLLIFYSNFNLNFQKRKIRKRKKRGEKQRKRYLKHIIYYKINIDFKVI